MWTRHLSGELAHRVENRPVPVVVGDHLVSDRRQAAGVHLGDEALWGDGEVPERKEDLPLVRQGDLFHRRGVDPGNDLAAPVDLFAAEHDFRARLTIGGVRKAGRLLPRPSRRKPDAPRSTRIRTPRGVRPTRCSVRCRSSGTPKSIAHSSFPSTEPVPNAMDGVIIEDRRIPGQAPRKKDLMIHPICGGESGILGSGRKASGRRRGDPATPPEEGSMVRSGAYNMAVDVPIPLSSARERAIAALKEQGFGVLTEIDVKATLRAKLDVDFRKYVILGACNPPLAHRALSAEIDLGVLLPCNVAVYEKDAGISTIVAIDPNVQLSKVGRSDMAEFAAEVRALMRQSARGGLPLKRMYLAIETSCDDTCAAVLSPEGKPLSSVVSGQLVHAEYIGVVPELASREHLRLGLTDHPPGSRAGPHETMDALRGIAVTQGPGLVGCLLVGLGMAKGIALASGAPDRRCEPHRGAPARDPRGEGLESALRRPRGVRWAYGTASRGGLGALRAPWGDPGRCGGGGVRQGREAPRTSAIRAGRWWIVSRSRGAATRSPSLGLIWNWIRATWTFPSAASRQR